MDEAAKILKELKRDDFDVLKGIKKPTPAVILGMELACGMFKLKPKKEDMNKVEGDTGGFFTYAKANLLANPN